MIYSNQQDARALILGAISLALSLSALTESAKAQEYTGVAGAALQFPASQYSEYDGPNSLFAGFLAPNSQSAGEVFNSSLVSTAATWDVAGNYTQLSSTNYTEATGTDGTYQVGYGSAATTAPLEWAGTPASQVNLNTVQTNPLPATETAGAQAYAVFGNQAVGAYNAPPPAQNPGNQAYAQQAYLWTTTGTPGASGFFAVGTDLSKASGLTTGYTASVAQYTDGTHQVGFATDTDASYPNYHAVVWSNNGTAATVLSSTNNSGFASFRAYGISGTQIVGFGNPAGANSRDNLLQAHATLWLGTGSDPIDLNPAAEQLADPIVASEAFATDGTRQIGFGLDANENAYALLWFGTASSAIDLNALLPSGYNNSQADAFDALGDILGIAYDASGALHNVEWINIVPEPNALVIGILGAGLLGVTFHRRGDWG